MKKTILAILLVVTFSLNIFSQIDFSSYPEISPENLDDYEYTVIYQCEGSNIILVTIEGKTYIVYYWYDN